MSAHAAFAPSSAHRWLECPASVALAAEYPNRSSAAAEEGTRIHALIDAAIKGAPLPEPGSPDHYPVALTVGFARKLGEGVQSEVRGGIEGVPEVWGTCDICHDGGDVYTIADYKNGFGAVEAEGNKQLLTYAASKLHLTNAVHFRLAIIQPNDPFARSPVKQCIATRKEVEDHKARIIDAIARAKAGEEPAPGSHCRYCPAFGGCSRTQEDLPMLMEAAKLGPETLHDNAIVRVARMLRSLSDMFKLVDAEINRRGALGHDMNGADAGSSRTVWHWGDEAAAAAALRAAYGDAAFKVISPAQAEKLGFMGKDAKMKFGRKPAGELKMTY